jgi:alkylation response protein AidB-like acyl-CoA dehydrogenase
MDFSFSDQQELLKKEARRFFDSEFPKKLVRELQESDLGYSPEIRRKMADLGWLGLVIPEEYGGAGGTLLDLGVLFEEVGKTACPSSLFATMAFGVLPLLDAGNEEQKRRLLPRVASGDLILTMALSEPEADYQPKFMTTRAQHKDGHFTITGTKLFVPYAHAADVMLLVAASRSVGDDGTGITVFLVPKEAKGIVRVPLKTVGRDKQFEVTFNSVRVLPTDVLGEVDGGWPVVELTLQKKIAILCVETVGVMQQELSMTAEYTSNRVQFGRPIGSFQAVQHQLADMLTDVEGARWLSYRALSLLSDGLPARREVAIAKAWVSDACQRVAYSAQHLHGGIGMDLEYDLHFYFEWAKARQLTLGSTPYHLASIEPAIRRS